MAAVKPAPAKARKKEESNLLAQIRLKFGARPDILMVRINTGVFDAKGGYKVRSAPNGYGDLQLVQRRRVWRKVTRGVNSFMPHDEESWFYYGQAIYIETKTTKGKMTKDQINFMNAAMAVGAEYILARCMEDVEDALGSVPEWCARG